MHTHVCLCECVNVCALQILGSWTKGFCQSHKASAILLSTRLVPVCVLFIKTRTGANVFGLVWRWVTVDPHNWLPFLHILSGGKCIPSHVSARMLPANNHWGCNSPIQSWFRRVPPKLVFQMTFPIWKLTFFGFPCF